MKIKKYRVWDNFLKKFYHFELNNITFSERLLDQYSHNIQQFIGILDYNMKEIYENDVVTFKTNTKEDIGVVKYMNDYCSYVVEVDSGYDLFADIQFDSLEVVGNMVEDYMYNEKGKLVKYEKN